MKKKLTDVLLVETDLDIRIIYKYALENIGKFKVHYAGANKDALTYLIHYTPDLILIDMELPETESISLIKEIREIPRLDNIPIIIVAPKINLNEITYYQSLGTLDVVNKPFDPLVLAHEVVVKWDAIIQGSEKIGA